MQRKKTIRKTIIVPEDVHLKLWNLAIKQSGKNIRSMQSKIDFLIQFYKENK